MLLRQQVCVQETAFLDEFTPVSHLTNKQSCFIPCKLQMCSRHEVAPVGQAAGVMIGVNRASLLQSGKPGRLKWPGVWPLQLVCGCAVCDPKVAVEAEVQRDVLRLAKDRLLTLWEPSAEYAQTAAGAAAAKAADIIRTIRGELSHLDMPSAHCC